MWKTGMMQVTEDDRQIARSKRITLEATQRIESHRAIAVQVDEQTVYFKSHSVIDWMKGQP